MSEQQQNPQKPTKSKEQMEKEKANTDAWHKKQQEKKKKKLQEKQQQQKPVELDQKALEKAKRKEQKRIERQQMLKEQQLAKQAQSAETAKPQQSKVQQFKKLQTKKELKKVQEKQSQKKQGEKKSKKQAKKITQSAVNKGGQSSTNKGVQSSANQQQVPSQKPSQKLSKDSIPTAPTIPAPTYTQLLTLQHHISKSFLSATSINKSAQSRLIHKYLDQYINQNDTVLVLTRSDSWQPLSERCLKRVYLYPNHNQFEKKDECENITCTYEDVAYLMEGTITKIFVELDMVFANGVGMTEKGNQNIVCMANEFKIPVIGFSGTWNFNAWNFLSLNTFINKYGEKPLTKYDIIQNQQLEIIVLEIGSVIPKQISGHLENLSKIYRGCDFNLINW